MGAVFVDRIEGCYFNVVGLPLKHLYSMLQRQGKTAGEVKALSFYHTGIKDMPE